MKEIVIKLEDDAYNFICSKGYHTQSLYNAIKNGIVLPEQHGRIIDADELLTFERPKGIADDVWKESHIYKLLSNAPTIIEATKEGE